MLAVNAVAQIEGRFRVEIKLSLYNWKPGKVRSPVVWLAPSSQANSEAVKPFWLAADRVGTPFSGLIISTTPFVTRL
jgi:hypothetical protein